MKNKLKLIIMIIKNKIVILKIQNLKKPKELKDYKIIQIIVVLK